MRFWRWCFVVSFLVVSASAAELFEKSNLVAWCIVPFDARKRSPEERGAMLEKMGLKRVAYDWRQEHLAEFEREILAYQKHGIEMMAFWGAHEEAFRLFQKYQMHPQLWLMLKADGATQEDKVKHAAETLLPTLKRAEELGCKVGIYNHGGWGGEPANMVAVCEWLRDKHGVKHVGIVYNLHHGHSHLAELPKALTLMKPWLLCLNLNGMDVAGDTKGRKILPLGVGTEDLKVLRQVRASGYSGPVGILNHTDEDAEGRLLDNLDGLNWLLPQLDDAPAKERPKYRTWQEAKAAHATRAIHAATSVESMKPEFGKALSGGLVLADRTEYRELPFTVECRARLESKKYFNILVASAPKSSADHWELYTHAKRGTLAFYLPGQGGDFDSQVDVCDGQWHDFIASADAEKVVLWIDGKQVLERPIQKRNGKVTEGGLAIGRLVEGGLGCEGVIDDVRISRGAMKPRKTGAPRQRMDNTLGLWNFDDLAAITGPAKPSSAAFSPELKPLRPEDNEHWQAFVNRERVFDYYEKQALHFMKQKPVPELLPGFPGLDGGKQGHWGNQNDQVTWRDGRYAAADHGTVFSTAFKGAGLTIPKAVCVRYGDKAAAFDPETLTFRVRWQGGFIKLSDSRHGFMGGGQMDGIVMEEGPKEAKRIETQFRGFYRHGQKVVFSFGSELLAADGGENLEQFTKGGPSQWPQWLETKGTLGTQQPFATDRITIPFENPYGTLFFISGHDFFNDGTAAVSTMTGEVWLVRGVDDKLEKVRWKRFATGLHQPLGVRVVKDKLYVLGRDQITCLHDLNGDDEADFYECVTNVMETSPGGHDYITGLEVDAEGSLYFASGNQGLCRIKDGALEVLGTGFRNPNGLGLSADGRYVTTSVQEGDWTPASSICQVDFMKNKGAHFGAGGPRNGQKPEPVLLYMPRGEDNSSGGQCFLPKGAWPELRQEGSFMHFSPGTGSAFFVMRQEVKGQWQAAAYKVSGNFDSGVQAGRFHPTDGHLYASGMQGWGCYTPQDGCFQRLRYTGGGRPLPVAVEARDNGILIEFHKPVSSVDKDACFAQCWNYLYSAAYGSPEYSLKHADTPGHDPLEIKSVVKLADGKSVFLEIPQLQPASQIHLHLATGTDLFLTSHALAEPFMDFPGYTRIAKAAVSAAPTFAMPQAAKPNPWASGEPGRKVVVEAALGLQYVQKELRAKPGERLSLTFKNPDVVPHNWMLAKPNSLQKLGALANLMITDPQGLARHYVPESEEVLVYTDMINPKAESTIHFTAPSDKGQYPYLCTFPGHWMVMNGVLKVE
jgi:azurin/sugar phosphate isomerase/epimerase